VERDDDFSAYVHARWGRLVRSAVLLGCTPTEAEDLVQTALVRCLVQWRKVQRADDRDAYVHRVLINAFVSSRRRRWTGERPTAVLPERSSPDFAQGVDDTDVVLRALAGLTSDQRAVVVLRYYAHLSEKQISSALGIAAGTVKSRLSRALTVLGQDPHLADLKGTS